MRWACGSTVQKAEHKRLMTEAKGFLVEMKVLSAVEVAIAVCSSIIVNGCFACKSSILICQAMFALRDSFGKAE